jgi:hypothetical protein
MKKIEIAEAQIDAAISGGHAGPRRGSKVIVQVSYHEPLGRVRLKLTRPII